MQKVTIYTTDYCPYCDRVKLFFEGKGVPFEEIDITHDNEKRAELVAKTNHRTVPQVFIGDTFVGGCDDVLALDAKGGVDALLNSGDIL